MNRERKAYRRLWFSVRGIANPRHTGVLIRLLGENKNRLADIKTPGRFNINPARRKVAAKPTLSGAEAELAAYELNGDQTDTQESDPRAPIRHTLTVCRYRRGKRGKVIGTASVWDGKRPTEQGCLETRPRLGCRCQ